MQDMHYHTLRHVLHACRLAACMDIILQYSVVNVRLWIYFSLTYALNLSSEIELSYLRLSWGTYIGYRFQLSK
jgi:hypothetical protein